VGIRETTKFRGLSPELQTSIVRNEGGGGGKKVLWRGLGLGRKRAEEKKKRGKTSLISKGLRGTHPEEKELRTTYRVVGVGGSN